MELHVGCAMWTYAPWQGRYLPDSLSPRDRLHAYATWCNAVEGNTTFYATPALDTVKSWAGQTAPGLPVHPQAARGPSPMSAASPTPTSRSTRSWPRSNRSGRVPTRCGFSCRRRSARRPRCPGPFPAPLPPGHRYCVEVRHRAFFADPRSEHQLERALEQAGAEWVTFDTTVLFGSPPASDAEREAWRNKPRVPRRSRALTSHPVVRYIGRDDPARTIEGWQPWLGTVAGWLREGRSPTVFIHTPDNVAALELARRFHDEVRARVPEVEPLPEPVPAGPPTLF